MKTSPIKMNIAPILYNTDALAALFHSISMASVGIIINI
jgi:hypothetical protein